MLSKKTSFYSKIKNFHFKREFFIILLGAYTNIKYSNILFYYWS